jgi:amidase
MAKFVADAAVLLGVLEGAKPDPNDPATARCATPPGGDYTRFLKRGALKGARIGIPRAFFCDPVKVPGRGSSRGGLSPDQKKVMEEAIALLKEQGAVIVDPADIPSVVTQDPQKSALFWNTCAGASGAKGRDTDCSTVFKYGMKRDFNTWVTTLGPGAPVKSLTELRNFNRAHQLAGAIRYGQAQLDISDEMDLQRDRLRYEADLAKGIAFAGKDGIDAVLERHRLDALLFAGATGYAIAAIPGYPTVIVPFGMVPNAPNPPFPAGFDAKPSPYGVSFTGTACSEPRLIELAYAFEQAVKRRRLPPLFP